MPDGWDSELSGPHQWRDDELWAGTSGYNPATYFYYDGWSLVQEGSSAAVAERLYVHGGRVDEMVASQVNGVWYHHHYDAQGNCIMQTTASGGLQVQYDYDGFGFPYFYNAAGGKGAAQTRFLFTGREWLADHRLYDFRARMYQAGARPISPARSEAVRRRRLQSLSLLP